VHTTYNIVVYIISFFLKGIAHFNLKIKLFVEGRKNIFAYLQQNISADASIIWIHTASLGEFEQGLPIIEKLKKNYPEQKILITFFSPSGYEVKKNSNVVDFICYLPLDSKYNAKKFISLVNPKLVIFVKYEIWPSYLNQLKTNNIPTLLTSAIFNKKQIFFKWYGAFMRKSLLNFTHFFVQDERSEMLLNSINIKNVTISGDTRFDRVIEILDRDNSLGFMNSFKGNKFCLVAGSTWPEDEKIVVKHINTCLTSNKYIIAPHNINATHIKDLVASITKNTIVYSEIKNQNIASFDVLVIDTIGLLTKIYSYADVAYVGGAFATGLHNTLEPAVFGIPIIIGPNYDGFKEAKDLVTKKGIKVISNISSFNEVFNKLAINTKHYKAIGKINKSYVTANTGASTVILDYIKQVKNSNKNNFL